jgi:hypothetical protein
MTAPGSSFDALLVRGAVIALVAVALWLLAVVVALALEAGTRGRLRLAERAGCPRVLRLWLLPLFVVLLAGVTPAQASDHGSPRRASTDAGVLEGLQLPDRPDTAPGRRVVVVRAGDTLWSIATDQLRRVSRMPSTPSTPAVAAAVRQLHAANRDVIGPDPDLIRPGQHLMIPEET